MIFLPMKTKKMPSKIDIAHLNETEFTQYVWKKVEYARDIFDKLI